MKVQKAIFEILDYPKDVLIKIERAARTCYKSEDKITSESAEALVRNLIKRGHEAMIEMGGVVTVKFYSNRGFTHELVRHRIASFAQESTRYCNYSQGKFGGEITCVDPKVILSGIEGKDSNWGFEVMMDMNHAWTLAEEHYLLLISKGVPPEIAREVLPIGLKAEIVIQANIREWRHIFTLRNSPKAHPRMREMMGPLLVEFKKLMPTVFDDLK